MAVRYYDDAIIDKIKKWIPEESNLRILKPDETKRLFAARADDKKDAPLTLPIIALSRSKDIELLSPIKQSKSFDGLKNGLKFITKHGQQIPVSTSHLNVIPIQVSYQLDIYTKTYEEADEYVRSLVFKLINNPTIVINIPYNNMSLQHIANLRVQSTISDTSDIAERLFPGQFTRWSIQIDLHDGFLFSIPYRTNWTFGELYVDKNTGELLVDPMAEIEPTKDLADPVVEENIEPIKINN